MPTPDELAAERRRKSAAAAIVYDTEQDDPDAVARDLKIARELSQASERRVPRSLVSQYRPEFQQLSDLERARKILAASPKLAEWGIDPDNAALSKDDLERLARIERLAGDGWIEQPTAENVNADPKSRMSTSEVVLGNVKEVGKGLVKGVASDLVGKGMEGTGQLLSGLSQAASGDAKEKLAALAKRIGQAKNASDPELAAIESDIDLLIGSSDQGYAATSFGQAQNAHADFARYVLGRVRAGRMTPNEADDALAPMFAPSLVETVGSLLQQGGEAVQASSEETFKAAKGFENSIGRQIGETAGVALGVAGATAVNPALGVSVALAASAGAGASDARKATPNDESTQTRAALLEAPLGFLNALPVERVLFNPAITRSGMLAVAEWLGKKPFTEGTKNALQKVGQNAAARATYDPNHSYDDGVWDSFLSGAIVGGAIDLGGAAFRAVTGKDTPGPTAEQKQAAVNAAFDESAGSKTRERASDTFQSFSAPAFKDGPIENVHLRAAVLDEHSRSQNIDPLTVVDTLNGVSRKDYATAMAVDGDLRIPSAAYAARIAGSDADVVLRPHLRVDPAYTTTATPEVFPHSQDDASLAAAQAVHDGTIIELSAAGYSPEAAASEALLRSTLYKTMATRAGTNPMPPILPASPDALLQSDIPVLNSDGLMNSTSPLALDGRDKAAPPDVLPETMNDVQKRVDPNPIYGPDRPRNHWED